MPLHITTPMPTLLDATEWINGLLEPEKLIGHPVLLQFWAVSCPACKTNMPRFLELEHIYAEHGLYLLSVHMPRLEADMDVERVRAVVKELGLTGPCAIDNEHAIGDRFETGGLWPSYFFFDREGKLRSRAAGATGLKIAENSLKRLLSLNPVDTVEQTLSEARAV